MDELLLSGLSETGKEIFQSPAFISPKERSDPPFESQKYVFAIIKVPYDQYRFPFSVCFIIYVLY